MCIFVALPLFFLSSSARENTSKYKGTINLPINGERISRMLLVIVPVLVVAVVLQVVVPLTYLYFSEKEGIVLLLQN